MTFDGDATSKSIVRAMENGQIVSLANNAKGCPTSQLPTAYPDTTVQQACFCLRLLSVHCDPSLFGRQIFLHSRNGNECRRRTIPTS